MRDVGLVKSDEPFQQLLTQGMVLKDGSKMSKSKGNTVDPQALIEKYGADTVRLFTIFASPPEQSLEWNDTGVEGAYRFLKKLWRLAYEDDHLTILQASKQTVTDWSVLNAEQSKLRSELHSLLQQANRDVAKYQFNTVVAAAMKMVNLLSAIPGEPGKAGYDALLAEGMNILLRLLAPIVPHVTHHLWLEMGNSDYILDASWPEADDSALVRDTMEMVIQVNGKLRGRIDIAADATRDAIEAAAMTDGNVQRFLEDKTVRKVIIVPGKLVNIVVS